LKQGILITAYKNVHHLEKVIAYFDENFYFFIHIDRKSHVDPKIIDRLQRHQRVFISRKYKVNWGGFNHLRSILLLIEAALSNNVKYLHLISGHDFPIKKCATIRNFPKANYPFEFIEYFPLPTNVWKNGGLDRILYYNFYDLFDAKSRLVRLIRLAYNVQRRLNFQREYSKDFPTLYGGTTWWSLSSDCLTYVLAYIKKNPLFLKRFKYTFCSEELFFQTVIMNSPFKKNVVNDSKRFIVWERKHGNCPANLDLSDLDALSQSDKIFARRFEYPVSEPLLETIIRSNNLESQ
jgi:hypothetical protein